MRVLTATGLLIFSVIEMLKASYLGAAISALVLIIWLADGRHNLQFRNLLILSSASISLAIISRSFSFSPFWNFGLLASAIFAGLAFFTWRKPKVGKFLTPAAIILGVYLLAGSRALPSASRFLIGDGRTGYVVSGTWASPTNESGGADIQSEYASSRFIERIGAAILDAGSEMPDLSGFSKLVLFTPTRPLTAKATDQLMRWVRRGGRLIVIVDHTDLFGHGRVANQVLSHAGVRANYDAILPPVGGYVYYQGTGTSLAGLTACSLEGRGDPVYWTSGYAEDVDYGGASFFGDLTPTEGDRYGLHLVGMRTTCGLGEVVTFGDSTFFANFSLERHASSVALQELIDGPAGIPLHDFALLAMLCMLLPWRIAAVSAAFLVSCLYLVGDSHAKSQNKGRVIELSGDTDLTDQESGPLAALLASHHAYGAPPIHWVRSNAGSGHLSVDGFDFRPARHRSNTSTLESAMNEPLSTDFVRLLNSRDLKAVSHFGTVWFDDGVGVLRDEIFRSFWKKSLFNLGVEREEFMRFGKINGNPLPSPVSIKVHWLTSGQGWALLGRGYVARWIPEQGVFLVRNSWQINHLEIKTFVIGGRRE
jgi:hypothetical protein